MWWDHLIVPLLCVWSVAVFITGNTLCKGGHKVFMTLRDLCENPSCLWQSVWLQSKPSTSLDDTGHVLHVLLYIIYYIYSRIVTKHWYKTFHLNQCVHLFLPLITCRACVTSCKLSATRGRESFQSINHFNTGWWNHTDDRKTKGRKMKWTRQFYWVCCKCQDAEYLLFWKHCQVQSSHAEEQPCNCCMCRCYVHGYKCVWRFFCTITWNI